MTEHEHPADPTAYPAYPAPGAEAFPAYPAPGAAAYPVYPAPGPAAHPAPGPAGDPGDPRYTAHPGYPGASGPGQSVVAPTNVSAIVLLVISILAIIASGIIGPPSAVLAALALKRNVADPARSARQATIGWIVLSVNTVVGLFAIAGLFWWLAHR